MNHGLEISRRTALLTAGLGVAAFLAGCDSSPTPTPAPRPTPIKAVKLDKDAPIDQRVLAIVAEQLGLKTDPKLADRLVEDLHADSLDCVELVMSFEEEFNLKIPDKAAANLKTIADVVAYIESHPGSSPAK